MGDFHYQRRELSMCEDALSFGHGDPFQGLDVLSTLFQAVLGKSKYPIWKCGDGTYIRIEDMTELHLTNAISSLHRSRSKLSDSRFNSAIGHLEAEQAPQGNAVQLQQLADLTQ